MKNPKYHASDNFDEANIEDVLDQIRADMKKAEEDAAKGIPPEPVFCMINGGPPPCEVEITEESQKICADILCGPLG